MRQEMRMAAWRNNRNESADEEEEEGEETPLLNPRDAQKKEERQKAAERFGVHFCAEN